ncbi:MAG: GntR family transcriptional regulator [Acidimicrobiia bacterium]
MFIRLDPRSEKPIYRQIAESIASSIRDGTLDAGDRLPSARSLAGTLDVNMHTVLHAYSELQDWGLVVMRRGRSGVVVAPTASLTDLMRRLVGEARRQKLEKRELAEMLEEIWR